MKLIVSLGILAVYSLIVQTEPGFPPVQDLFTDMGRPLTLVNDPFSPIVHLIPDLRKGKLILKLKNGYHRSIQVSDLFLVDSGSNSLVSLLNEPIDLAPAEVDYLDVTADISSTYFQKSAAVQETVVKIRLYVEPQPQSQPEDFEYLVRFESGSFTGFESNAGE